MIGHAVRAPGGQGPVRGVSCLTQLCSRGVALQALQEDAISAPISHRAPPMLADEEVGVGPRPPDLGAFSCGSSGGISLACSDAQAEAAQPRGASRSSSAKGVEQLAGSLRNAGQAMLDFVLTPLASVLGAEAEEAAEDAADVPEMAVPPPRLLRGAHRLVQPRMPQDAEVQGLLGALAADLGAGPNCLYEGHAAAPEPGWVNVLTNQELLLMHASPPRVEWRWALDGIDMSSVRAEGSRVLFTAKVGIASAREELKVGQSALRCVTAEAACQLAERIRAAAAETPFLRLAPLAVDATPGVANIVSL